MKKIFGIAGASVQGRNHRETNRNNQDSFYYLNENELVGIVCDGCGSGKHSEVGAKIGASIVANEIKRVMGKADKGAKPEILLKQVRDNVSALLLILINSIGDKLRRVINDYFLFTIVGFFGLGDEIVFFILGDGVIIVNGEIMKIGPFENNEPPYLAYSLCETSLKNGKSALDFKIVKVIKIDDFKSALIGTDGVADLINSCGKKIPGKIESAPEIKYFWEEERFFQNPDLLRRKLSFMSKDSVKYKRNNEGEIQDIIRENGFLKDDTSMLVLKMEQRLHFQKSAMLY